MVHSSYSQSDKEIYERYIADVSKYPLLEREEERILIRKASEGSKIALDRLVTGNLKFVINVAFMYKGQGLSLGELINEGNLGLIEAAGRFDAGREIKFISYAVWWIRQSITRAIAEKARIVRISAEKELVLRRFNKQSTSYKQVVGGQYVMDADELAEKTDYNTEQVENIIKMGFRHASLDVPMGEDGQSTVLDLTKSLGAAPDELAQENSKKELLTKLLSHLSVQEQKVISLYFGIGESYSLNLKEIGGLVGLSKERVRQVKERALSQLRDLQLSRELAIAC